MLSTSARPGKRFPRALWFSITLAALGARAFATLAADPVQPAPLAYQGEAGPGAGKHVVLIASDHEYRSEEILPMLARVLAKRQGFRCTVLFGVDETTGEIKPGRSNIPGTDALKTADLLVIYTRFQNLPAEQMRPLVDYLERGGPVVGLRTATHGFKIPKDGAFAKFDSSYGGADFQGGFGRQILGETWVGHYGANRKSSTRLDIVPERAAHPVLAGVKGAWSELGGYNAWPIEGSEVLALAQPLLGMEPTDPADPAKKPLAGAWTRQYVSASGQAGRVFATTYGGPGDLENEGFRRMLVNACLWATGLEDQIRPDLEIGLVGPYHPTWRGAHKRASSFRPQDMAGWEAPIPPQPRK